MVLTGLDDESLAAHALAGRRAGLSRSRVRSKPAGLLRALRYAVERKTMEEALFAEKERAQVTLNSIGDAVVCTDIAGNITFLNLVAEKMTGWSLAGGGRDGPWPRRFAILDANKPQDHPESDGDGRSDRIEPCYLPPNCILIRRDGFEIPDRRFRRAHPRSRGHGDRRGHRVSRRQRGAGDGAADGPFGRA